VDVAGLADVQAANEVRVGHPGTLLPGGAFVSPGDADELVRGFQPPPVAGQPGQRLRIGSVQHPHAAVGGRCGPAVSIAWRRR
jgi:hypothetical protein